ncbi:hypothetical protein DL764_007468 [Monosporascus ibericus]|uniref:BTB domain-containing protein n=1 Tax=Monosporascus ibericus TaxID=155417 RepID=A0A4Q4T3X7_9PEZI|nr:hypothetical protein DL764_007468 [Monosporascus ibericus]
MATASFQSILESKLVQFVIGPEKKEFLVHEYAVSSLSKPLDRLLNGQMKEATEGRVVWDDMDEAAFVRFIQWAYSGSYTDPEPVIFTDSSVIATSTAEDGKVAKNATATAGAGSSVTIALEEDAESVVSFVHRPSCSLCYPTVPIYPSSRRPKCEKCPDPRKKRQMVNGFISSSLYACSTHSSPPRQNKKYDENYALVFLAHARLYVMADKYDLPQLSELALHKLWATLKIFTPYPSRLGDIVCMITYAFHSFSESAEGDKMCDMLVHYSGCIYENLTANDGFKTLVEEYPLFTHGLMKKIAERLS